MTKKCLEEKEKEWMKKKLPENPFETQGWEYHFLPITRRSTSQHTQGGLIPSQNYPKMQKKRATRTRTRKKKEEMRAKTQTREKNP
jgi:hypothetical protein